MHKRKKRKNRRYRREFSRKFFAGLLLLCFLILGIRFLRTPDFVEVLSVFDFGSAEIVIDAGHGGHDVGANNGGVLESEINLSVAKKLEKILKQSGYEVAMTRKKDVFVELSERAEYANRKKAKVFVSIHCNSSEVPANGIETFYGDGREESMALADEIQKELILMTEAKDRGGKEETYAVIVKTKMPAVLVEIGFLNDAREMELLQSEEYQTTLAEAIATGIVEYLEEEEN